MATDVLDWPTFEKRCDCSQVQADFISRGFICLENYLSADELERVRFELERYKLHVIPKLPPEAAFFEDKQRPAETLIRLERMLQHDAFFKELASSPVFNGLVDRLLGVRCEPNNVQFFCKPPGAKATPPHQDGQYFMHDRGVTLWLALSRADAQNGCMYYVPESHKLGLLEHIRAGQLGFSQELKDFSPHQDKELCMETDAGTLLAHHPYTVHRAGANTYWWLSKTCQLFSNICKRGVRVYYESLGKALLCAVFVYGRDSQQRWRPALGLTFWAEDCHHDDKLSSRHKAYQDQLKSDLLRTGKI